MALTRPGLELVWFTDDGEGVAGELSAGNSQIRRLAKLASLAHAWVTDGGRLFRTLSEETRVG
jgi:hypothetical protein